MTIQDCYDRYHALIVWTAVKLCMAFPEEDPDDLIHAAYVHLARYMDRISDEYNEARSVAQIAKWGMLRYCLPEMRHRNQQKTLVDPVNDSYRLDAMSKARYVPKCERLAHSIRHFQNPDARIYVDEILRHLPMDERNLILQIAVIGKSAIEIGHERGISNIVVLAKYHGIMQKIRWRLANPAIRLRPGWAKPLPRKYEKTPPEQTETHQPA